MGRRRSIIVGSVAAVVALAAAFGATAAVRALDDDEAEAEPEVELSFDAEDDESDEDDLIGGDVTGTAAPSTSFALLDGDSATFADFRGAPLVVNFFASWCPPCVEEMPAFEDVHQAVGDDVQFLGIDLRDSVAAAEELVQRTGVTYAIGRDPSGDLFTELEGVNMPTTFFISADGLVLEAHAGAMTGDQLRAKIDELFLE